AGGGPDGEKAPFDEAPAARAGRGGCERHRSGSMLRGGGAARRVSFAAVRRHLLVLGIFLAAARAFAQPSVLLVTLDTTRPDHLTAATAPALEAFATGARSFTRCYTPVPYTLPAHASILSGQWPKDH